MNLDDCDVETLHHDGFIGQEDCAGLAVHTYTPDPVHVHFFLRFPLSTGSSETKLHDSWNHPSRDMAFHAAKMISRIVEDLAAQDHLRHCPAYIVHTAFSAFVMHVYQMRSPELCVRRAAQDRLHNRMQAIKKISPVWLVGKMVHRVLELVVDNRLFKEHCRKAKDV
ncbi:Ctf1 transcription factor [Metarhizium brunneum]